jgi:hypothetical protein
MQFCIRNSVSFFLKLHLIFIILNTIYLVRRKRCRCSDVNDTIFYHKKVVLSQTNALRQLDRKGGMRNANSVMPPHPTHTHFLRNEHFESDTNLLIEWSQLPYMIRRSETFLHGQSMHGTCAAHVYTEMQREIDPRHV